MAMKTKRGAPGQGRQLTLRKILVGVDFSESSLKALSAASYLAFQFGASVHLVHVRDGRPLPMRLTKVSSQDEVERRIRLRLKDVAVKAGAKIRRPHLHVLTGMAYREICRLAAELRVDWIVLGTRGLTGLKHLALGSTAERVVRHAPCPILVLHSLGRNAGISWKKILVPTDFSPSAAGALEEAKKLARRFRSRLQLLHSLDLHYYSTNPEYMTYDYPSYFVAAEKAAQEQLEEQAAELQGDGFKGQSSFQIGHAGAMICQFAEDRKVDLVVMGSHGHSGLKDILLGSTAEYVVRHATRPVLVVPRLGRIRDFAGKEKGKEARGGRGAGRSLQRERKQSGSARARALVAPAQS